MLSGNGLIVSGLRRRIADFTLEADFAVRAGEIALVSGRSGSGKTSLLRMIAGLDAPDSGSIRIGEEDVSSLDPRHRRIGMVFQDQALFPSMDVLGNVVFGLKMQGAPREERERLGLEWLKRAELENRARSQVGVLSGGEAQRVALLRTWIANPRVLLLDEPFTGLDPGLRRSVQHWLLALLEERPVPVIWVTHEPEESLPGTPLRLTIEESSASIRRVKPIKML